MKLVKIILAIVTIPAFVAGAVYESAALWFKAGKAFTLLDRLSLLSFILSEAKKPAQEQEGK